MNLAFFLFCLSFRLLSFSPSQLAMALESATENVETERSLRDLKSILISGQQGEIRMSGWGQDRVRVLLKKTVFAETKEQAQALLQKTNLSILETPTTVELRIASARGENLIDRLQTRAKSQIHVDWEVKAPWNSLLDLAWQDGDIIVTDWRGVVRVRNNAGALHLDMVHSKNIDLFLGTGNAELTNSEFGGKIAIQKGNLLVQKTKATSQVYAEVVDGEVRIERCEGNFQIQSEASKIRVAGLKGDLSIRTNSEPVEAKGIEGSVEIQAQGASIVTDFIKPKGLSWIESEKGQVEISLPPSFQGFLDLFSVSGDTVVQFPVNRDRQDSSMFGPEPPGNVIGTVGSKSGVEFRVTAKKYIRVIRQ